MRTLRFLPHTLLGLAVILGTPSTVYCADDAAAEEEEFEETSDEPKAPSPGALKFWSALKLLESKRPEDIAAGRAELEAAASLEFPHAQFELGRYLVSGSYGFKKSARKGANQFILAAERGNGFAMVAAGQCYYWGVGVSKNLDKAEKWLKAAVEPKADYSPPESPRESDPAPSSDKSPEIAGGMAVDPEASSRANAHFILGLIQQSRKDFAEAHKNFVAGGSDDRDGNIGAARQAALDYAFGIGTTRDPPKARELLARSRKLATRRGISVIQGWVQMKILDEFATADLEERLFEAGDEFANEMMLEIAERFSNKKSKDYNAKDAAEWYEVAADAGQSWAMIRLALMHGSGELGTPDLESAFKWWQRAGGDVPPKSTFAAANLAICYENGIGVERDPAKAAEIHASNQHLNYLCHLGAKGSAPKTVQTVEQATRMLEAAAKKGDSHAQYLMGFRYRNGGDVKVDHEKSYSWFKKAAKGKHAGALRELGKVSETMGAYYPEYYREALDYYKQASDLGDAEAAANFAFLHQSGKGTARRPDIAETYYLRAIDLDPKFARSYNNLSTILQDRLNKVRSSGGGDAEALKADVLRNLEKGSELGLSMASYNLGRIYINGDIVPQDIDKGYSLLDQAAADGLAEANYALGVLHETGTGVPVTPSEALYHYRLAALEGHRTSLHKLIDSYVSGRGVDVDLDRATFWLFRAFANGDFDSVIIFADLQLKQGNYKEAFRMFRLLTQVDSPYISGIACERLSRCYESGIGVKANPARAKKYYELALSKNNGDALAKKAELLIASNKIAEGVETMTRATDTSAVACYFLGQMYYFGTNVEKDEKRSLELMRKAARGHHTKAMYFLAAATFNRVQDAPDVDEAIRLAESAEKMGHPEAKDLRQKLELRRDSRDNQSEQTARARSG